MTLNCGDRAVLWGAVLIALGVGGLSCGAQSTPQQIAAAGPVGAALDGSPVFDVAVIRPNPGDTTGHSHIWSSPSDGHLKAQNVTALELVRFAFAVPETRVTGGPPWMRSAKFDMEAKSDPAVDEQLSKLDSGAARQIKQRMLQALLADRLALKTHEETHVLPIYVLEVAKGGPKFQPSTKNGTTINGGNGRITVQGSDHTVALLAEQLSRVLGRVVVDKTGLDGRFELTLRWTQDDMASATPATEPSLADGAPSLFTAIEEQLGLKLKSEKGPVPILVIDHLEMPSAN